MVNTLNNNARSRSGSRKNPRSGMKNKKIAIIMICCLAVVAISGLVFAFSNNKETNQENAVATATPSAEPASTAASSSTVAPTATENSDGDNKTPKKYEGSDPNDSAELSGVINYTNVAGSNLSIGVTIDQYLSSGTCALTMKSGSRTYTATVEIKADVSTSYCDGFTVPLSKLSGASAWDITIELTSGDKTGVITGQASI